MFKLTRDISVSRKGTNAKYPFAEMEIGESFYMPDPQARAAARSAHQYSARNPGYKFNTRKDESGIRIWRVKFHHPAAHLGLPIYLETDILNYLSTKAKAEGIKIEQMVNDILKTLINRLNE